MIISQALGASILLAVLGVVFLGLYLEMKLKQTRKKKGATLSAEEEQDFEAAALQDWLALEYEKRIQRKLREQVKGPVVSDEAKPKRVRKAPNKDQKKDQSDK